MLASRAAPASLSGDTEAASLVDRLIDLSDRMASPQSSGRHPAVLLDVEVRGVRCLLVRFRPVDQPPRPALSPREREIVRMVAKGYPNKAIAAVLEISAWTVSTHIRRIFAKLSVNSRAEMVAVWINERT